LTTRVNLIRNGLEAAEEESPLLAWSYLSLQFGQYHSCCPTHGNSKQAATHD
jgi:hypothetical protein